MLRIAALTLLLAFQASPSTVNYPSTDVTSIRLPIWVDDDVTVCVQVDTVYPNVYTCEPVWQLREDLIPRKHAH